MYNYYQNDCLTPILIFVFCREIMITESHDIMNIFLSKQKNRKSILAHCKANNVDGNKHINSEFFANIS